MPIQRGDQFAEESMYEPGEREAPEIEPLQVVPEANPSGYQHQLQAPYIPPPALPTRMRPMVREPAAPFAEAANDQPAQPPPSSPPGTQWLQNAVKQAQQRTSQIPYGPVPGQRTLLPQQYGDLGNTRPFGPGESVRMPDGTVTSEESYTSQLANGKWAVIPGLWLINGVPHRVREDQAVQLANQSGLDWVLSADSQQAADKMSVDREGKWEQNSDTRTQPPLWRRRNAAP